ncbi:MAG: hypothetical protein AAGI68_15965 [Planctomycetota bacterium]
MSTGRQRAAWWHTASVVAVLAELHRDKKRRPRPFEPREFHPLVP